MCDFSEGTQSVYSHFYSSAQSKINREEQTEISDVLERPAKFDYKREDYLVYMSFNYSFFRRNDKRAFKMDKKKYTFQ